MYWKIYNIQSGQLIKAGFQEEDDAREWLEKFREGKEDNYVVEEMEADEWEEWKHENGDPDENYFQREEKEEDFEDGRYDYKTEDDEAEDDDDLLLGEVYEVDEDEDDSPHSRGDDDDEGYY